jgi:hypothetical protein
MAIWLFYVVSYGTAYQQTRNRNRNFTFQPEEEEELVLKNIE